MNTNPNTYLLVQTTRVVPNPNQPRKHFKAEKLAELSDSIKDHGVIEPLIVYTGKKGKLILIAGERRWRAAIMAGCKQVPVIIRDNKNLDELALIENIHREDMNPVELGLAYKALLPKYKNVPGLALKLNVHRKKIDDALMFADTDPEIQALVIAGKFPKTPDVIHTLSLIADKATRIAAAEQVSNRRLTVKQAVAFGKKLLTGQEKTRVSKKKKPSKIPAFEFAELPEKLTPAQESKWNAMTQSGALPTWEAVRSSIVHTCKVCGFGDSPESRSSCKPCPLPAFLKTLVDEVL